jgi:hypothetical protein
MTTRQRYTRILEIIEGISHVERAARRVEAERNRDAISIFTKVYAMLLGEALQVDPKSKHIKILV